MPALSPNLATRRRALVCVWFLVLFFLSGCSSPSAPTTPVVPTPTFEPLTCAEAVAHIVGAQSYNEQAMLRRAVMLKYLLIEDAWIADGAMSLDGTRVTAEQIVVLTAADADALQKIKDALALYLEDLTEDYRDYQPAELPKLQSAVVRVRGLDVALIVSPDAAIAASALDELWGK